jgi:hypothetical protein
MAVGDGVNESTRITDPEVLNELILRLGRVEASRPESQEESVSVTDVAEALDQNPVEVTRALQEILRERARERVITALREIEEPLYRVERPGHSPTIEHQDPLMRIRIVQELTARAMPPVEVEKPHVSPQSASEKWVAAVITFVVLGAMVVLLLWAVFSGIASGIRTAS